VSSTIASSAAAPHVAGALALLLQRIGGSFSPRQCSEILSRRAIDATGDEQRDNVCGSGRLCLSSDGCD